jgi:hypothetical protein
MIQGSQTPSCTHGFALCFLWLERPKGTGDRRRLAWRDEQPRLVRNYDVGDATDSRPHDGQATQHCFYDHKAEALARRHERKHVHQPVQLAHVCAMTSERHALLNAELRGKRLQHGALDALTNDEQVQRGPCRRKLRGGPQEVGDTLVRIIHEPSDGANDEAAGLDAELLAERRCTFRRRQARSLGTVVDDLDLLSRHARNVY